jgi:hypothetical protein
MVIVPKPRLIQYAPPPPQFPNDPARKLAGPRYDLAKVKEWGIPSRMSLITRDCQNDVLFKLRWTLVEVAEAVQSLAPKHYRDSEWCDTGVGLMIDCDSYALRFDTLKLEESAGGLPLYLKFGFRFPANNYLLMVSCHPS